MNEIECGGVGKYHKYEFCPVNSMCPSRIRYKPRHKTGKLAQLARDSKYHY